MDTPPPVDCGVPEHVLPGPTKPTSNLPTASLLQSGSWMDGEIQI